MYSGFHYGVYNSFSPFFILELINRYNKTRDRLTDTEDKLVVTTEERKEGEQDGMGIKMYKLLCIK